VSLDIADHENSSLSVPYVAGRLKQFRTTWQSITPDSFELNAIKGVKIGFANNPEQTVTPRGYCFNETEVEIIDMTIEKFLETGVIEKTKHSEGEYISNILFGLRRMVHIT